MDCSRPGLPDLHYQTHVHFVSDDIQPCHPLLRLPSIFPSIGVHSELYFKTLCDKDGLTLNDFLTGSFKATLMP